MEVCRTSASSVAGELSRTLPAGAVTVVLRPDDADATYRVTRRAA